MPNLPPFSRHELGSYLREQRHGAQMSLRQLSDVAGVSNPYLSQIERGLKKPSAEILQQLAKGLRISAESLYVRAGLMHEVAEGAGKPEHDVTVAILADRRLSDRQRSVLLDVYQSFVGEASATAETGSAPSEAAPAAQEPAAPEAAPRRATARRATPRRATPRKATSRETTPGATTPRRSTARKAAPRKASAPQSDPAAVADEASAAGTATTRTASRKRAVRRTTKPPVEVPAPTPATTTDEK